MSFPPYLEKHDMTNELRNAIDRSRSHNEIVRVVIDGDSGDALGSLRSLLDDGLEMDYAMLELDRWMTVWAFDPDAPENEVFIGTMVWRLDVRFEAAEE